MNTSAASGPRLRGAGPGAAWRGRLGALAAQGVALGAQALTLLTMAAAMALLLTGCQFLPERPRVDVLHPAEAWPSGPPPGVPGALAPQAAAAQTANGAIYRADSYRPLFEAHRARLVGDTLTVQITEKLNAVQRSTSQVDRSAHAEASLSSVPILGAASALARLGATGSSGNNFAGKGSAEASNDFTGAITATVVQVLPNGHLIVAGEKQIGVQANVDVLRFSGQVDPRAIQPGNTVESTRIANVRIEQRGRGQQADVQHMGWLARFFMNLMPL